MCKNILEKLGLAAMMALIKFLAECAVCVGALKKCGMTKWGLTFVLVIRVVQCL